jgi:hypothetical protein
MKPQPTSGQQEIVPLTPVISVAPQQQGRPPVGAPDNALSINISLMP